MHYTTHRSGRVLSNHLQQPQPQSERTRTPKLALLIAGGDESPRKPTSKIECAKVYLVGFLVNHDAVEIPGDDRDPKGMLL